MLSLLTFCCEPLAAATTYTLCNTATACGSLLAGGAPDPSYSLTLPGNAPGTSVVVNPNTYPASGPIWIADSSSPASEWIGPEENQGGTTGCCAVGNYIYEQSFTVVGTGPVPVIGRWAADNEATMYLSGNGPESFISGPDGFAGWTSFDFEFGNNVSGTTYTLTFVVDNTDNPSPTGLRVEFDGTSAATPEPLTFATLGVGLVVIGFIKRKRFCRPTLGA